MGVWGAFGISGSSQSWSLGLRSRLEFFPFSLGLPRTLLCVQAVCRVGTRIGLLSSTEGKLKSSRTQRHPRYVCLWQTFEEGPHIWS